MNRSLLRIGKRIFKLLFFRVVYPLYYLWCARKPVNTDKVVFIELMAAELTSTFQILYERLTQRYTFDVDILLLNQLRMRYRRKVLLNFSVIKAVATAGYVFIDNTFPVVSVCPIRPETKVIQTWHGCGAFKRFGYSLVKAKSESSGWDYKLYPLHAHYDHVFVSGHEAVWAYADAFAMEHQTDRIEPIGVSRTDVFWDEEFCNSAREEVYSLVPAARDREIILYAPTYRKTVTHAQTPTDIDIAAMASALSDRYVLLMKLHPFVKNPIVIPEGCEAFAYDVSSTLSIESLLVTSDVCVSDYSSLVFEFSLFERPILFFVPDLDMYYDARGFYYTFEEFACGPICKTTNELIDHIAHASGEDLERIRAFKEKFMDGCDGHATERILDSVFGRQLNKKLKSKEPV